jgi:hypothetical protein
LEIDEEAVQWQRFEEVFKISADNTLKEHARHLRPMLRLETREDVEKGDGRGEPGFGGPIARVGM